MVDIFKTQVFLLTDQDRRCRLSIGYPINVWQMGISTNFLLGNNRSHFNNTHIPLH